ncbi:hypothetical protein Glove_271g12 [Diversispora epigaea]|uniref:Uncharacterized protein n=1 Tax=Diversispora epigaea TaxID=1348612 RepID=A0A397IC91_9GLOM|nr:hypothetical protein Glove_271g12 [Diversispora epigaea]
MTTTTTKKDDIKIILSKLDRAYDALFKGMILDPDTTRSKINLPWCQSYKFKYFNFLPDQWEFLDNIFLLQSLLILQKPKTKVINQQIENTLLGGYYLFASKLWDHEYKLPVEKNHYDEDNETIIHDEDNILSKSSSHRFNTPSRNDSTLLEEEKENDDEAEGEEEEVEEVKEVIDQLKVEIYEDICKEVASCWVGLRWLPKFLMKNYTSIQKVKSS